MKITKKMFKSFEGLEELKKMKEAKCCNGINCQICPLGERNLNKNIVCTSIIDLDGYAANDLIETKKMSKLIDIFTKEKINSVLSELAPNRNLKYNDYVVYDNKTFKIKGVLENSESFSLILLNECDTKFSQIDEQCITNKKSIKKGYNLLVEPAEIFALNDIVIEEESNTEYEIVAIATPDYPILLNDHVERFLNINDCEDVLSSVPEAHERNYNKWVSSYDIKHK